MKSRYGAAGVIVAVLGLFGPRAVPALAERRTAEDHPLLSRFPEASVVRSDTREFDSLLVPLGPATGIGKFEKTELVEGAVTRLTYEMPEGHSTLEVLRSYRDALESAGFSVLFECALAECGNHLYFQKLERPFIIDHDHRFLAARGSVAEIPVFVTVRTYKTARHDPPVRAMVEIAEPRDLEADLIRVDAESMAREIASAGHVSLYGIHFDTDRAEIRPDSEPTLREMAKLLAENPELSVYIVGHTDNTGTHEYNLALSRRRAHAVVEALVSGPGIARARLTPAGVGPLAPVASNDTASGRSRNRRVELVER